MYYRDFARINRLSRYLEQLAYASVAIDVFVAGVTLMSTNSSNRLFNTLLYLGGLALGAEIVIASMLAVSIYWLRHYEGANTRLRLAAFKMKYSGVPVLELLARIILDIA